MVIDEIILQETTENHTYHAADLLNQQIWCWGRDIDRQAGNWLLETGFDRSEPPTEHSNCPSIYQLNMPQGKCIILRGFGVYYGDQHLGGIFIKRHGFVPLYNSTAELMCPPWRDADLPKMELPDKNQQKACISLTLALVQWIYHYEKTVIDRLGIDYRHATLVNWDNGKRPFIPAEEMVHLWHDLLLKIASTINE